MTKLDRAIVLAQHELKALKAGEIEKAEAFMDDRRIVLSEAYAKHDEKTHRDYIVKLVTLQDYNVQILEIGTELRNSMRKTINSSQKSVKVVNKYMQATI